MKCLQYRFNRILASQISFVKINAFVDAKKSGKFFCVLGKHLYQCAGLKMFKLDHSLNVFDSYIGAVNNTIQFPCRKAYQEQKDSKPGSTQELIPQDLPLYGAL